MNHSPGKVYLVGAGPGDPGLITLRGAECLRRADVVLFDYLVNPRVLELARQGAEFVCLGRHGQGRIMPQDEVNQRMIRAAAAGKTVVRLKGGDPAVFARGAQELAALALAGITPEIVPGITAALASGSYAGVPITHRDMASAAALVTAQQGQDGQAESLDYAALARFPGTLVFYMGVTTAPDWTQALMAGGKPADTPVAVVRRCSWPDQSVVRCTLGSLCDELQRRRLRPPVIVVVGEAAARTADATWFTARPLFGQRVVVTRPAHQAASLRSLLEELGAEVLIQPAIEISGPPDWREVDEAMDNLGEFDFVVFSSTNGVRYFLDRLLETGRDMRCLSQSKLAVVGPGTAEELARYCLRADVQPAEFRAEALAAALAPRAAGRRCLLLRASRGREVLAEELRQAGAAVTQVVCYSSLDVQHPEEEIKLRLSAGQIDWITVTSSAIARSLAAMFGDDLRRTRLASISPVTSETLRETGFEPAVEAETYTMDGVVQAMRAATS